MEIVTKVKENGLSCNIGKDYLLNYPDGIWDILSERSKSILADNIAYLKVASYASLLKEKFSFSTAHPLLRAFFDRCAELDLPRMAFEDSVSASSLKKRFQKAEFSFSRGCSGSLADEKGSFESCPDEGAVLSFSLGKDSLLSYALAKEIGIPMDLVFFEDMNEEELIQKKKLISSFQEEFRENIHFVRDGLDDIHLNPKINRTGSSGIYGSNAMSGYMMMLLPFASAGKKSRIIFGNEQNFNDHFTDMEGFMAYPSYEQSAKCMLDQNKALDDLTGGKVQLNSLIEPLYNIAEVKVLFRRYPQAAKYQMSCSLAESEDEGERWCYKCPMCAKSFLYLKANGIDPSIIRFNRDLFSKEHEHLYPLFNKEPKRVYEKPKAVRDEQLFAFYLAFKLGCKGHLIDKFKRLFLGEAKEREDHLYDRFFTAHDAVSIRGNIKEKVTSIFDEELSR
ncbi:hypothetical protein KY358_03685 [Candidatus Woesearchaeota archaeon]|nr:hypothetical protein [Candidatus Woesearchaeota archaeon]